MNGEIVDRLKIVSYRLSKFALPTSLKKEVASIIEQLEENENDWFV